VVWVNVQQLACIALGGASITGNSSRKSLSQLLPVIDIFDFLNPFEFFTSVTLNCVSDRVERLSELTRSLPPSLLIAIFSPIHVSMRNLACNHEVENERVSLLDQGRYLLSFRND
jgi:hypothetical protein